MVKVTSWDIIEQLKKRHKNDMGFTEVKNGSSNTMQLRKIDYMAIKKSWSPITLIGYEVKVSRSDFVRDDKWYGYLENCNMFSFAAPKGMIKLKELPENVGLVEYNPEKRTIRTKRKPIYREIKLNAEMLLYLMMWRMKIEDNRYGAVGETRAEKTERWKHWLEEKVDNKVIGRAVKGKFGRMLRDYHNIQEYVKELEEFQKTIQG